MFTEAIRKQKKSKFKSLYALLAIKLALLEFAGVGIELANTQSGMFAATKLAARLSYDNWELSMRLENRRPHNYSVSKSRVATYLLRKLLPYVVDSRRVRIDFDDAANKETCIDE